MTLEERNISIRHPCERWKHSKGKAILILPFFGKRGLFHVSPERCWFLVITSICHALEYGLNASIVKE